MDTDVATEIIRKHLNRNLTVTATRPLHGGMVNRVEEWITDGRPSSVVAKLTDNPDHKGFRNEFNVLAWHRKHTDFPVPEPFAYVSDESCFRGSALLMQKVEGRNLGETRLSTKGMKCFEVRLAHCLANLHGHKGSFYGSALKSTGATTWLEVFRPRIESEFSEVESQLSAQSRSAAADMLAHLDTWMPECGDPTLVHGDLWATNIVVDDGDADNPVITGFVDGGASYADVEYELAYLRVFNTAGREFFSEYSKHHALREGFERRCRIYWLHTMLLHLHRFGTGYLSACEDLAREIGSLA